MGDMDMDGDEIDDGLIKEVGELMCRWRFDGEDFDMMERE